MRETETERGRDRETETESEREAETETQRQRQTERGRDRERERKGKTVVSVGRECRVIARSQRDQDYRCNFISLISSPEPVIKMPASFAEGMCKAFGCTAAKPLPTEIFLLFLLVFFFCFFYFSFFIISSRLWLLVG